MRVKAFNLFLISLLSLYFELLLIRWLSSEIRIFAYFKNLPLMACLFGLGVGMSLARSNKDWTKWFPLGFVALTAVICLAEPLHLVHITFLDPAEYYTLGHQVLDYRATTSYWQRVIMLIPGLITLLGVFYVTVVTFLSLGQKVGKALDEFPPLQGYSINVAASLTGVALFSLLSFLSTKPFLWVILGSLMCVWFYRKPWQIVSLVACMALSFGMDNKDSIWSPYYRVDLKELEIPADGASPRKIYGTNILVNHDAFQGAYDNSKKFLESLTTEQKKSVLDYYDLLYEIIGDKPRSVLILAAGSGNDVAAALRHGATRVDCVEIDPRIAALGKALHPERPYDDPRVHVYVDDARAFMHKTHEKYDLVDFAYLDSHSAFSSMSSLRLDNYVYTKESFEDGVKLLKPGGQMSVTFYAVKYWQIVRIFKTLLAATGLEPVGFWSKNGSGLTFFYGPIADAETITQKLGYKPFTKKEAELGLQMEGASFPSIEITSDDWPFLFLRRRAVDYIYGAGMLLCLLAGYRVISTTMKASQEPLGKTMFCLGAAFMLVETKSISQVALLLGTTWVVNSAIISGILIMILFANLLVTKWKPKKLGPLYGVTMLLLFATYFVPLAAFSGLPYWIKLIAGSGFLSAPLFCAALIFASTFDKVKSAPTALGMNLLGALIGGALEYLSMATGIAALNVVAALIYALAWWFWTQNNMSSAESAPAVVSVEEAKS